MTDDPIVPGLRLSPLVFVGTPELHRFNFSGNIGVVFPHTSSYTVAVYGPPRFTFDPISNGHTSTLLTIDPNQPFYVTKPLDVKSSAVKADVFVNYGATNHFNVFGGLSLSRERVTFAGDAFDVNRTVAAHTTMTPDELRVYTNTLLPDGTLPLPLEGASASYLTARATLGAGYSNISGPHNKKAAADDPPVLYAARAGVTVGNMQSSLGVLFEVGAKDLFTKRGSDNHDKFMFGMLGEFSLEGDFLGNILGSFNRLYEDGGTVRINPNTGQPEFLSKQNGFADLQDASRGALEETINTLKAFGVKEVAPHQYQTDLDPRIVQEIYNQSALPPEQREPSNFGFYMSYQFNNATVRVMTSFTGTSTVPYMERVEDGSALTGSVATSRDGGAGISLGIDATIGIGGKPKNKGGPKFF